MNNSIKNTLLWAALLLPTLSNAAWWENHWRGDVYYNSGTQTVTDGRLNTWKDIRWQGQTFYCGWGGGNHNCTFTFGESVSTSLAKSVGLNIGAEWKFLSGGIDGSLTWTKTTTHVWNATKTISPGWNIRPYIYVPRAWTWGHFNGVAKYTGRMKKGGCFYRVGCYPDQYEYEWYWENDGSWGAHVAQRDYTIATFAIWKP